MVDNSLIKMKNFLIDFIVRHNNIQFTDTMDIFI